MTWGGGFVERADELFVLLGHAVEDNTTQGMASGPCLPGEPMRATRVPLPLIAPGGYPPRIILGGRIATAIGAPQGDHFRGSATYLVSDGPTPVMYTVAPSTPVCAKCATSAGSR